MSELRQDATTYDWIIIAKERAKRPDDFKRKTAPVEVPAYDPKCPFCVGNESLTPETTAVFNEGGAWKIRSVPNKFPALTPEGDMVNFLMPRPPLPRLSASRVPHDRMRRIPGSTSHARGTRHPPNILDNPSRRLLVF